MSICLISNMSQQILCALHVRPSTSKIKVICFVFEAIYKKLVPVHILTLHRQGWNLIVLFTVFRPPLKLTDTNTMALNFFTVFLAGSDSDRYKWQVTDPNTNGGFFVPSFAPNWWLNGSCRVGGPCVFYSNLNLTLGWLVTGIFVSQFHCSLCCWMSNFL